MGGVAQNSPEAPGERKADLVVDLGLRNAIYVAFNRVLKRNDIQPLPVQLLDGRIERVVLPDPVGQ